MALDLKDYFFIDCLYLTVVDFVPIYIIHGKNKIELYLTDFITVYQL